MALVSSIKLFSKQTRNLSGISIPRSVLLRSSPSINNERSFAAAKKGAAAAAPKEGGEDDELKRQQDFKTRLFKTLGAENIEQEEDEIEEQEVEELRKNETETKKIMKKNPVDKLEADLEKADSDAELLQEYAGFAEVPLQHAVRNLGHGALPDRIKMEMYKLWRKDPKYWTLNNLASKFHTIPERAYAIIVDKRMEHQETILEGRPLDTWHQEAFEKEFAIFITDRVPNDAARRQDASPHFDFLDGDISRHKGAYLLRKSLHHPGFGRVPHHELPDEPPKRFTNLQKVRTTQREILKPSRTTEEVEKLKDEHNIPNGGGKITFVDSSPRRHPYTREIYVMEVNGSVRTASWEERKELLKPPSRMLSLQSRFEEEIKANDELFGSKMRLKNEAKRNEPNEKTPKTNVTFLDVLEGNTKWMKERGPTEFVGTDLYQDAWDIYTKGAIQPRPPTDPNEFDPEEPNDPDAEEPYTLEDAEKLAQDFAEAAKNGGKFPVLRNPHDIPPPSIPPWFSNILGTKLQQDIFKQPRPFDEEEEFEEDDFIDEESEEVASRFADLAPKDANSAAPKEEPKQ